MSTERMEPVAWRRENPAWRPGMTLIRYWWTEYTDVAEREPGWKPVMLVSDVREAVEAVDAELRAKTDIFAHHAALARFRDALLARLGLEGERG